MINISLDLDSFIECVVGIAKGSHLRQRVWEELVFPCIPLLSKEDLEYLWYTFRRKLWNFYLDELNLDHCRILPGAKEYLHVLAALHSGNRYRVKYHCDQLKKDITVECYRFDGKYYIIDGSAYAPFLYSTFNSFVESEKEIEASPIPYSPYSLTLKESIFWETDPVIYDTASSSFSFSSCSESKKLATTDADFEEQIREWREMIFMEEFRRE